MKRASFFVAILFFAFAVYFFWGKEKPEAWSSSDKKTIAVVDGGSEFYFSDVAEKTVGEFLAVKNLSLQEGDSVFPNENILLFSGTTILLTRAQEITVHVDGNDQVIRTQARSVGQALVEGKITLDEDDIAKPGRDTIVTSKMKIVITRVQIEEQTVEKPIAFEKKVNEDSKLSWRKIIVTQKGEKGIQQLTYRVSKYDGKEVNRKLLRTETTKEPVTEVTTQGTYVQIGKTHKGAASWYAWTGTMAAANPWLPKGSYVRVTNLENGKSVIVVINDRGPFVAGRIIDLDKVAFAKIASIGAGVINVTMEVITN